MVGVAAEYTLTLILQQEFQSVIGFRVSKDLQAALEKLDPQVHLDLLDKQWVCIILSVTPQIMF